MLYYDILSFRPGTNHQWFQFDMIWPLSFKITLSLLNLVAINPLFFDYLNVLYIWQTLQYESLIPGAFIA